MGTSIELPSAHATAIFEDNMPAIAVANHPSHHGRTKHYDIRHVFVLERIALREVTKTIRPRHRGRAADQAWPPQVSVERH